MKKIFFLTAVAMAVSCSTSPTDSTQTLAESEFASGQFEVIADTITYDVIISNPNKDDSWTESCLQYLKKDEFVSSVYEMIKEGKLTAYHYESNQPLTWGQIDSMKASNDNKMVMGKIQFREIWAFDKVQMRMYKKVHSAIFGYETYSDEGEVRNHKAAFKIYFK